ncbi:duplicated orphan permease [Catalinimonas alkaloidigena]|uniref:Duplicated orphan permease n=1 Tax=Catalinimonas alkaloidigena TaxID=1075417 RepID=A0A1G9IMA2_9BACT|nr:ABC transporter permease [Catalinimonas alkaloidigena]SDL26419.1 duplicated orphan permease [Catalinimonas alkaloidigena]
MFLNYLKVALRNLRHYKGYGLISILGLALGITSALLIFLLVQYHLGFDAGHAKADRIYRIVSASQRPNGARSGSPGTPVPMAEAVRQDFSEVELVAPINHTSGLMSVTEGTETRRFREDDMLFATPEFFEVFDFPVEHQAGASLARPGTVLLTRTLAEKLFPRQNPVGQSVQLANRLDLTVTGVLDDPPVQSSLPFSALISYQSLEEYFADPSDLEWGSISSDHQLYVLLHEGITPEQVEARMPELAKKYKNERAQRQDINPLQPLREVHFDERYGGFSTTVSKAQLGMLAMVAFFLILLACINFVNLATAQAVQRGREVGIRKVLGSGRGQLITQFLGETALIVISALVLTLGAVQLLLPTFNQFVGQALVFAPLRDPWLLGGLVGLTLLLTVAAGLYPALLLSGFQPAQVLKGRAQGVRVGGLTLRQVLVGFQFVAAQVLLIGTLVVWAQTRYLQTAEMGFNREAVVTVPLPDNRPTSLETFRQRLETYPEFQQISFSNLAPASDSRWMSNFGMADQPDADVSVQLFMTDAHYADLYRLPLLAGRMLQESDTVREYVVNEALLKVVDIATPEDAIGRMLRLGGGEPKPIVGVVQDFHQGSLREKINPALLMTDSREFYEAALRLAPSVPLSQALAHVEAAWTATFPEAIYSYAFLDDEIAEFYRGEERITQLLGVFAGIAIFIGCLGLYGLVSFVVTRRTKEIGVRKVLGASLASVVSLVSREFGRIALLSFLIATPLAWYLLRQWLSDFPYHVSLHPGYFVVGGMMLFGVAALSVSYQSLRAALINPVQALKTE